MKIAVLCTRRPSAFESLSETDCYDKSRGAKAFSGGAPVIAMPPCKQWCRLRAFARADDAEKEVGLWCAAQVQKWGGVLEQPANSVLFAAAGLPRPGARDARGFTISVPQFWWGHPAQKATWLYIAGLANSELPEITLRLGEPGRTVPQLGKAARDATPPAFAAWLVETARRCQPS